MVLFEEQNAVDKYYDFSCIVITNAVSILTGRSDTYNERFRNLITTVLPIEGNYFKPLFP